MSHPHDPIPFIQRIFRLAADRAGGTAKLGQQLSLTPSELGRYMRGEAMPSFHVLLSTVDLVVDEINLAERPWQAVLRSYQTGDHCP